MLNYGHWIIEVVWYMGVKEHCRRSGTTFLTSQCRKDCSELSHIVCSCAWTTLDDVSYESVLEPSTSRGCKKILQMFCKCFILHITYAFVHCIFMVFMRACIVFLVVFARDSIYAKRAYAIAIPSVCPSVTRVIHAKTVEDRILQFSPYSSPIPLVFAR